MSDSRTANNFVSLTYQVGSKSMLQFIQVRIHCLCLKNQV